MIANVGTPCIVGGVTCPRTTCAYVISILVPWDKVSSVLWVPLSNTLGVLSYCTRSGHMCVFWTAR